MKLHTELSAQRRRGQIDAMNGREANYGCHTGMRSTLEQDRAEYYEGYNEVEFAIRAGGRLPPEYPPTDSDAGWVRRMQEGKR